MVSGILASMPLLQHTDGSRIAMSSSHHKQSQLLGYGDNITLEVPLIRTDFSDSLESRFFIKRALDNGIVHIIRNHMLVIEYDNGELDILEIDPYFNLYVKSGDRIRKGQIFMAHKSYYANRINRYGIHMNAVFYELKRTFEDAILVSESGARKLTSINIDLIEIPIRRKTFDINVEALKSKILKKGTWIVKEYKKPVSMLTSPIHVEYAEKDYEVISVVTQIFDPKIKISSQVKEFLNQTSVESELEEIKKVVNPKNATRIKKSVISSDDVVGVIRLHVKSFSTLKTGDKLVNRYGNKGTVSKIISDDEAKWIFKNKCGIDDPKFIPEIFFNPLGIHTRMNPSQLAELSLNYVLKYIVPEYILALVPKQGIRKTLLFLVDKIHKRLNPKYAQQVANMLMKLDDNQLNKIANDIIKNGLQIELPVFGNNLMLNIYEIVKELAPKYFNDIDKLGYGVFYILKLEHMVEKKINAVSTSKYSSKFQPLDGQRVGEMETWDIIAYDAPHTLYSMQKIKSDEPKSKSIAYEKIVNTGSASIKDITDQDSASKRLVESLLDTVGINIKTV